MLTKATVDFIHSLLSEYQKLAVLILFCFFTFPFIAVAVLYAERSGYYTNVYQQEHRELKGIILRGVKTGDSNLKILSANQTYMLQMLFVQQGICVNAATTNQEKAKCIPPIIKDANNFWPPSP